MDKPKILPVKSDIVFRMFFADERNIDFLRSFLKSVLQLPEEEYSELSITDPHLLPDYVGDKYSIIYIKLRTKSHKVIHVEIQLQVTSQTCDRVVFYDSKLITEQLGVGDEYKAIEKVISIIITEDKLIKESPKYHHRFTFYDSEALVEFSDIIEIHTLELDKLPSSTDGTELYDWAKFIAAESEEELKMVAERNPKVKKAVVTVERLSADEQARYYFEMREKGRRDISALEWDAEERGEKIGEEKIINLLKSGKSPEEIIKNYS